MWVIEIDTGIKMDNIVLKELGFFEFPLVFFFRKIQANSSSQQSYPQQLKQCLPPKHCIIYFHSFPPILTTLNKQPLPPSTSGAFMLYLEAWSSIFILSEHNIGYEKDLVFHPVSKILETFKCTHVVVYPKTF